MRGPDQCALPVHTDVCVVLHPGSQASLSGQDLGVGIPICPKLGFSRMLPLVGRAFMSRGSGWGPVSGGMRIPAHLQARPHVPPETLTRLTKDNKSPGPQGKEPGWCSFLSSSGVEGPVTGPGWGCWGLLGVLRGGPGPSSLASPSFPHSPQEDGKDPAGLAAWAWWLPTGCGASRCPVWGRSWLGTPALCPQRSADCLISQTPHQLVLAAPLQ